MTKWLTVPLWAFVLALAAAGLPAQVGPLPPAGRPASPPIDGEALKAAVDRILARVVVDLRRELHAAIDEATRRKGGASLEEILALLEGRTAAEGLAEAGLPKPPPVIDPLLAELVAAGLEIVPASSTFQRLHRVEDRRAYRVVSVPAGVERLPESHLARRLRAGDVVVGPAGTGGGAGGHFRVDGSSVYPPAAGPGSGAGGSAGAGGAGAGERGAPGRALGPGPTRSPGKRDARGGASG